MLAASMTTSSPEDAPRGMDFLYSRNRLNVATSRARCVSIIVAVVHASSPSIGATDVLGWPAAYVPLLHRLVG